MRYNVWQEIVKFIKEHRLKRKWRKVLSCLAAVVVFCTVYALILPAITLEATCGMQEHTHTDACYEIKTNTVSELKCSLETHSHSAECTDEEGNIICGKAEFVVHKHTDDCYKDGEIVCTLPEIVEHTHNEECTAGEENTCALSEVVLHTHEAACYDDTGVLICKKTEVLEHVHGADCFNVISQTEEKVLVCEAEEHTHTDDCYPKILKNAKTATQSDGTISGTVGTITWTLTPNADGTTYTLNIDGEGAVPNNLLYNNSVDSTLYGYKDQITQVVIGAGTDDNITSIGIYAFRGCKSITDISIPSTVTSIGNYAFYECVSITEVFIPSSVTSIGTYAFAGSGTASSSSMTLQKIDIEDGSEPLTINNYAFRYNMSIREITIPDRVTDIGSNAFYYCSSLQKVNISDDSNLSTIGNSAFSSCRKLKEIVIPTAVTKIGSSAFSGCSSLETVNISDNSNLSTIGSSAFYNCENLTEITIPSKVTNVDSSAFYGCSSLRIVDIANDSNLSTIGSSAFRNCSKLTEIIIPSKVTSIGTYIFAYCNALEKLALESSQLSSVSSDLFYKSTAQFSLIIGKGVDTLNAAFVEQASSHVKALCFEGPNDVVLPDLSTYTNLPSALQNVSGGSYYVDSQGVLYQLNEEGTATVVYASPDLAEECIIPHTITTVSGESYNITAVGSSAFYNLDGLTSLIFESPETIEKISDVAFTYLPNLSSVNGETTVSEVKGLFSNANFGINVFYETGLKGENMSEVQTNENIEFAENGVEVSIVTTKYEYYTGEKSMTHIEISPVENASTVGKVIRVYYAFSTDKGDIYGYDLGNDHKFENGLYTASLCRASGNIYYWEFPIPGDGETLSVDLELLYPSPTSAGGTAKIWGVMLDEGSSNGVYPANQYHLIEWITKRDAFNLTKTYLSDSIQMVSDGEKMYVDNMKFSFKMTRDTANSLKDIGKDVIQTVEFTDVLNLPENIRWRSDVLEAIQNDYYTLIQENSTIDHIYVTVGDEQLLLGTMSSTHYADVNLQNFDVKLNEANQIVFSWTVKKDSDFSARELGTFNATLTLGKSIIEVIDISKLQEGDTLQFVNNVTAVQHYTHSSDNTVSAQAIADFECEAASLKMQKLNSTNGGKTWNTQPDAYFYKSRKNWYKVSMSNTGVLPVTNLSYVEDTLVDIYFISGEDLQTMFDEDEEHRLTVTITGATLCDPIFQEVLGADGNTYTVTSQYVGSNTDYNGIAKVDDCPSKQENMVLTLKWQDNDLVLESEGVRYDIGFGKKYNDVQSALDAVGFVVTPDAQYKLLWQFEEGFRLFAGQEIDLIIRSREKTAFMLVEGDEEYYYSRTAAALGKHTNTAYAYDDNDNHIGLCTCEKAISSSGLYYGESIKKSVSCDGVLLVKGDGVEIGKVLDYTINVGTTHGTMSYDALPLTEQLIGGQVLIVPKIENEGASWITSETQMYTDENGVEYYILNLSEDEFESGTEKVFNKVYVGGMWADRVVINPIDDGGLKTRIHWYLQYTESGSIQIKEPIKALVAPDLAGYDMTTTLSYLLDGEVWLNDHETHRLWNNIDTIPTTSVYFSKEILPAEGVETDKPITDSIVSEGESVTYKLSLKIAGGSDTATLSGTDLCDKLPAALNNYWVKTTEDIQGNISITYSDPTRVTNGDSWVVNNITEEGKTSNVTQQYIHWDNCSFSLTKQELYIYVTITFPSDANWTQYVEKYGATTLENTLYVFGSGDKVTHLVKAPAKAVFQKGIYSTGIGRESYSVSKDNFYSYKAFTTESSREYYVNDTVDRGMILYYVTLANTGKTRLYINAIQDILPKGFSFSKMYDYYPLEIDYMQSEASSDGSSFSKIAISGISYKDCSIKPSVETIDGKERITFNISSTSTSSSYIKYDKENGKNYLEPNTGVRFAYYVRTNGYDVTEDTANNVIAMPYFDYNGGGVQADTETKVTVSNAVTSTTTTYNIAPNDGTRKLLDSTQISTVKGINVAEEQKQCEWLASDVTIYRGSGIKPGITKKVYSVTDKDGNTAYNPLGATTVEIIGWEVTATNVGDIIMSDYTITDIMQSPYSFAAGISMLYDIYDSSGTKVETIELGYLNKDADGNVTLNSGQLQYRAYSSSSSYPYTESSSTIAQTQLTIGEPKEFVYYEERVESPYKQSKVKITISVDPQGQEVLTLRFVDDRFAIPAGGKGVLYLYTKTPGTEHNNKIYSNSAYITPAQEFNSIDVGIPMVYNGEDSVLCTAPITVSYGYFTSSSLKVHETDDSSNAAVSYDTRNYMVVPNKDSLFTYTLSVTNSTDLPMDKLIMVDNFPEIGDYTPFGEERFSDYKVNLANDTFTVIVTERDDDGNVTGTKTLDPSQYTIEYSLETPAIFAELTDETEMEKLKTEYWTGSSFWSTSYTNIEDVRAVKMTILDDTGTVIPANAIVSFSFNAKADSNQQIDYGMTAWNSFGYRYSLLGIGSELESAPTSTGVRIPYIPSLEKELENSVGGTFTAEQAETFRFIIHTGKMLSLNDNFTEAELAQALTSGNRIFTYVTVTVPAGAIKSEELVLDNCKEYTYTDGQWVATDADWVWDKLISYTIVELPSENVEYAFGSIASVARNGYNFPYDNANSTLLNITNIHRDWSIRVNKYSNKVDEEGNKPTLAGAIFGLYSPDANDLLSDAAYAELTNTVGKEIKKIVEYEGATYYLSATGTSDTNGIAQFDSLSLSNVQYVVAEIMAPSGYVLQEEATPVLLSSANESLAEIEVVNEVGYVLPHTGGEGRTPYIIVGMLTTGIAGYCIYKQAKRRRKEGMAS